MAWTDEKKAEAIEHTRHKPNSREQHGDRRRNQVSSESPNGVRMVLTKAGVYVKKAPAATVKGSTGGRDLSSRYRSTEKRL